MKSEDKQSIMVIPLDEFHEMKQKMDQVLNLFTEDKKQKSVSNLWLDASNTCKALNIAKRTLQDYTTRRILGHTRIAGKIYYNAEEINQKLNENYVKPKVKL